MLNPPKPIPDPFPPIPLTGETTMPGSASHSAEPATDGALVFWYRNYKGEEGYRRAIPISIRFGVSEWHKEPQWLMLANDTVNGKQREFAMKDMQSVIGSSKLTVICG